MLTEKPATPAAPAMRAAGDPADPATLVCLFEGRYVPLSEAKVSIMTHAFMYGTAVFEGIRAYWNADQGQLAQGPRAHGADPPLLPHHAHG